MHPAGADRDRRRTVARLADAAAPGGADDARHALVAFCSRDRARRRTGDRITYSPLLRDTLYPNLVVFQLIPKGGAGAVLCRVARDRQRVARRLRAFVSFFPIVISACVGFANTESLGIAAVPLADGVGMADVF